MKIIKEGDLLRLYKTKRFECERCGCVFDASAAEYKVVFARNDTYRCCICPTCRMEVIVWDQPTETSSNS